MAYTAKVEGMAELSRKLSKLGEAAIPIAAASLYEGAGVMADAVSQAVHGIATEPFRYAAEGRQRKPSPEEKALLEAAPKGVAKFKKTSTTVDTSIGLSRAGYGQLGSKTKPIPQIANAINSGTSFMKRQPFFRKATHQNESKANAVVENGMIRRIDEISKE